MPTNFNAYNPNFNPNMMNYAPQPYVPQNYQTPPQQYVQPQGMRLEYVHGIEGANAYQMPQGVTEVILWDNEVDSFYIKKLDEMGRPKVVAHKDFFDHVDPEPVKLEQPQIDMSKYMTQDDLMSALGKIDLSCFLTKDALNKALDEYTSTLVVGEQGKVVRKHEQH